MSDIIDVTAAILIKERTVLIAQRPINDQLAGYWEFPGGKIEHGEQPEECLAREMREEFSINIEVREFFGSSYFEYQDKKIRLLAYLCKWMEGQMQSTSHESYVWATSQDLETYNFASADIPLVGCLMRDFDDICARFETW
ncbi:MAG TPA: 8-oxo-dGTP diphosphatase MutT [Syntrophomonadaceae bacterium]|nr:8-oxo-dGTP diphosphatase MutT [Syntrophomonadaceae bacterium]